MPQRTHRSKIVFAIATSKPHAVQASCASRHANRGRGIPRERIPVLFGGADLSPLRSIGTTIFLQARSKALIRSANGVPGQCFSGDDATPGDAGIPRYADISRLLAKWHHR